GLGALQLISLVATSLFVSRTRRQLAVNPGLLAVRSVVEELLRVAAVLLAVLLWPADVRPNLGIWVGAGSALVWLVLATAQTVTTRQRIARPGDWSEEAISTMLAHRVGARSTVLMRLLDVAGTVRPVATRPRLGAPPIWGGAALSTMQLDWAGLSASHLDGIEDWLRAVAYQAGARELPLTPEVKARVQDLLDSEVGVG